MRPLRDETDFEQALRADRVYLFKHSTRCGASLRAYRQVTRYEEADGPVPIFLIDVITERDLSRAIADRLGIRHQSPQVILLSCGAPVWHASHSGVTAEALAAAGGNACPLTLGLAGGRIPRPDRPRLGPCLRPPHSGER